MVHETAIRDRTMHVSDISPYRAALLAVCLVSVSPAGAADTAKVPDFAPACAAPTSRELDFWIGEWGVEWSTRDGP